MDFAIDLKTTGSAELAKLTKQLEAFNAAVQKAGKASVGVKATGSSGKTSQAGQAASEGGVMGFLRRVFGGRSSPQGSAPAQDKGAPKAPKAKSPYREPAPKEPKAPKPPKEQKPAAPSAPKPKVEAGGKEGGKPLFAQLEGKLGGLKNFAKGAGIAAVAAVVLSISKAAITAAKDVAKFGINTALAFKGMGAYQAQLARYEMNLKRLFRGVDTQPLIRSVQRLADFFDRNRQTGAVMSKVLTQGLDFVLKVIEKLVPVAEDFATGALIAFLKVEGGAYSLAADIMEAFESLLDSPAGGFIKDLVKDWQNGEKALTAGKIAIYGVAAALGIVAAAIAIPVVGIGLIVTVIGKLVSKLDELGVLGPMWTLIKVAVTAAIAPFLAIGAAFWAVFLGITYLVGKFIDLLAWVNKATGIGAALSKAWEAIKTKASEFAGTLVSLGKSMVDGIVEGIKSGVSSAVEAAGSLVGSLIDAIKKKAGIKSPAKLFRIQADYMTQGVVQGLEEGGPEVMAAGQKNLVPSVPFPGKGDATPGQATPPASGSGTSITFSGPIYINGEPASAEVERAVQALFERTAIAMGIGRA